MKRNVIATIAGLTLCAAVTVAATDAPSPEQTARERDGIPAAVVYHGNYDRMNAHVTCYEGIADQRVNLLGVTVKRGHWVEYCNDGWISVQTHGDHFRDFKVT